MEHLPMRVSMPMMILTFLLSIIFTVRGGPLYAESKGEQGSNPRVDTCAKMQWNGTKTEPSVSKELDEAIRNIISGIKNQDSQTLLNAYHPRLHISKDFVAELFSKINLVAKAPVDTSVFRIWQVTSSSADGKKVPCDDYGFYPIFGYPEQIPVVIQVMGQNELSHLIAILVKTDGQWKIGASQYLQRTHEGKNAEMWLREGIEDQNSNSPISAFSKIEIAKRLIQDQRYLEDPLLAKISSIQSQIIPEEKWQEQIKDALKPTGAQIQRLNTILAKDGIGILVVIGVAKEESLSTLRNLCKNIGKALDHQVFFKKFSAVKCSFVLPSEKAGEEGKLGGLFMKRSDWQTR
jgi:hypothetical protein